MPEVNVNNFSSSQPDPTPNTSSSKLPWIILGVVVIVLVVLGVVFRAKLFPNKGNVSNGSQANSQTYQAVFLSNGQVYFGKLSDADKDYVTLTDIYYLQVVQPPLQGTSQDQQQQSQQSQISLVKLGNELHGPMDLMHINRSQVLFYEDLKNDGKVVQAIMNYKANPSGSGTTPTK